MPQTTGTGFLKFAPRTPNLKSYLTAYPASKSYNIYNNGIQKFARDHFFMVEHIGRVLRRGGVHINSLQTRFYNEHHDIFLP